MLDDLKYIHQRDGQDALGIAEKQWQQYQKKFDIELPENWQPEAVVLAGMGGSAQAASTLSAVLDLALPFEVSRNYDLPSHVGKNWLLICLSYSGNTEETISTLRQALARPENNRPFIICSSSGGQLEKLAKENNLPYIGLPKNYQPRYTFGFQCAALADLLDQIGLSKGLSAQLSDGAELVKKAVAAWRPDVATKDNLAKTIAQELAGRSPVIYAGPKLFPVAYKWKINFNENAKNVAWCNQLPEFNHNEFIGWSSHPVDKAYAVIELRSQHEHERVLKRFEVTDKLLSGRWPSPIVVDIPKGRSALEDAMWALALGDHVSIYLALLNGVNPTPVDLVEKFKAELNT